MNTRSRLLLLCSLPLALLAGCTSYYRNVDACKDRMRADYPDALLESARVMLHNRFRIEHCTIQVERHHSAHHRNC